MMETHEDLLTWGRYRQTPAGVEKLIQVTEQRDGSYTEESKGTVRNNKQSHT